MAVTAEITDITWFPNYPNKKLPPDTYMVVALVTFKNTGSSSGNIHVRLYSSVNGSDWSLERNYTWALGSGRTGTAPVTGHSPNRGTWHVAITAFGEDKQEPSLPDPATCP